MMMGGTSTGPGHAVTPNGTLETRTRRSGAASHASDHGDDGDDGGGGGGVRAVFKFNPSGGGIAATRNLKDQRGACLDAGAPFDHSTWNPYFQ